MYVLCANVERTVAFAIPVEPEDIRNKIHNRVEKRILRAQMKCAITCAVANVYSTFIRCGCLNSHSTQDRSQSNEMRIEVMVWNRKPNDNDVKPIAEADN